MRKNLFARPRLTVLLVAAVLLAVAGVANRMAFLKTAAEAYLYGYPLVAMDVTRERTERYIAPPNTVYRVRRAADENFREVVRPSVDLLYTSAFIDMRDGPFVYTLPANAGRYTLVPLLDAWSNVFASVGTRITGNAGARYLLAGAQWQGPVPAGLQLVRAPTRMVWMVARTQLNDDADLPQVHAVQDAIHLEPLATWQQRQRAGTAPAPQPDTPLKPGLRDAPAAASVMRDMPAADFFVRLTRLMVDNPAPAQDAPMLASLAGIGLVPGQPPAWGPVDRLTASLARQLADRAVDLTKRSRVTTVNGWWSPPSNLGNFGTDYRLRAGVAMVALAANVPADALYPTATQDGAGQPLHGDATYRLHFAKDQLPPVRAFWSVTAYGDDAFLLPNPWHRYSVRSGDPLRYNADGSLDLYIGPEAPPGVADRNWLPVRRGEPFQLTARLYWPQPAALTGAWSMPPLVRL